MSFVIILNLLGFWASMKFGSQVRMIPSEKNFSVSVLNLNDYRRFDLFLFNSI